MGNGDEIRAASPAIPPCTKYNNRADDEPDDRQDADDDNQRRQDRLDQTDRAVERERRDQQPDTRADEAVDPTRPAAAHDCRPSSRRTPMSKPNSAQVRVNWP